MIAYPIKFEPILQEKIWGGSKLKSLLNKASNKQNIGESWEISDVDNNISVVANGDYKGKTLQDLIALFKGDLVGEKVYKHFGEKFPLLIKFIDAKEALSIQLHPDDALAKKRHNSFGKTEMWYVMQADKNANLIVGFKEDCTKEIYLDYLNRDKIADLLNTDIVKPGDVYFIPTGRIHAIGLGVLLAEIQQTSDITYRIYDWNRKDSEGKGRELHTQEALDAIDYKSNESYKTDYQTQENTVSSLIECPYFTTNIIELSKEIAINNTDKDSFVIYICTKGKARIDYSFGQSVEMVMGETVLIPSSLKNFKFNADEASTLLEVFI
ncbi:MAG: class I mannose-6-phosphate isomerase [Flavobacteriales bacterium]|jgi:mannose-6-phosphate isomerase|nr:class I mannose-6-phosphate isomerase [Flavobacteriales bacterium]